MYIINEKTEQRNRIESLLSEYNLFECKKDVTCRNGSFTAGTLVRLDLEGYEDDERWYSLHNLRHFHSVSSLLKKSVKVRISVKEANLNMIKHPYADSSDGDCIYLDETDLDTIENTINDFFEKQTKLEESVETAKHLEESTEAKGNNCIDMSWILGVVALICLLIECVIGMMHKTIGSDTLKGVMLFIGSLTVTAGLVLFFSLNIIGGRLIGKAEKAREDGIETAYRIWKNERG